MELSICIPTFNRNRQLDNCLNSILIASRNVKNFEFEVCISDNASPDDVMPIIDKYKKELNIKINKNKKNLDLQLTLLNLSI